MTIAFDNSKGLAQSFGGITSLSTSFTVTGSNLFLVAVGFMQTVGAASSATYAGVSLTQSNGGSTCNVLNPFFGYLTGPSTGANTFVYTVGTTTFAVNFLVATYSGVDQGTPFGTTLYETPGAGANKPANTSSLTCPAGGAIVSLLSAKDYYAGSPSASSGTLDGSFRTNLSIGGNFSAISRFSDGINGVTWSTAQPISQRFYSWCLNAASTGAAGPAAPSQSDAFQIFDYLVTSGGSVSVNLTGQTVSISQQNLADAIAYALAGQALSASQGIYSTDAAYSLAGQVLAAAQGSTATASTYTLTGQATTLAQGAITDATAYALTGQATTLAQGSITDATAYALTGQAVTSAQGFPVAAPAYALAGQAVAIAQGTPVFDVSYLLAGQTATIGQGSVNVGNNVSVSLTGQDLLFSQGSVTPATAYLLTGQTAAVAQGTPLSAPAYTLAGQSATVAQGSPLSAPAYTLIGQNLTGAQGAVTLTYSGTGQTLSLQQGSPLSAPAYSISGQTLAAAQGIVVPTIAAFITSQALTIGQGSVTTSGGATFGPIARPGSDTAAGAWLPSSGADLYSMLNEVTPDDSNYIYTVTAASAAKMALTPVVDPHTTSGQVVSYRAWSPNGNALTVKLMQGASVIASWTHAALPTSPTTYQQALTAGQIASISDYTALSIEFDS